MRNSRQHAVLEIYQLVLAVFLFASPWLFAFAQGTLRVDTWVNAGIVVAISAVALLAFREWEEWIACILGLWIAISPWVFGFQHTRAMFINLAVGILITYLALLELWLIHYRPSAGKTTA
jgi:SPW repeat